jgi:stage II sporulation protein GA (sporulation sigma-E factor processing peptidase)
VEAVLYLDVLFLTELYFNFLALYLSALMGRRPVRFFRLLAAAALGSAAGLLTVWISGGIASFWFLALLQVVFSGSLMTAAAFSLRKALEIAWADGLLFAASALLAGLFLSLREIFFLREWECLFCLSGASLAAGALLKELTREKARGQERHVVRLFFHGNCREFVALVDSGNRLLEPVSRKPVSVIAKKDCEGFIETVSGVLYIPFRAVGTKQGLLPGIVLERMEIVREEEVIVIEKPIVAVTKEPLSSGGDFSLLLPEALLY